MFAAMEAAPMRNTLTQPTDPPILDPIDRVALVAALGRLERRLARLERMLDEGIGAYLNARFPYGRPTDKWARRG
jgi:hypothetical protein